MPRKTPAKPRFAALTNDECATVLARNHIGRIAFLNHGVVDIEPVHYVANGEWLFIRSAAGTKVEAFSHEPYVAFEVDEVEGPFDWRSVVVHGTVYLLSDRGVRVDRLEFERALRALRSLAPTTMTKNDLTPFRRQIYGVHVNSLTGRVAEQRVKTRKSRPPAIPRQPRHRGGSNGS
ncbi:MAG TPA: pyridoxamine 5'-phosphate oxidase family protein [Gemmatimonadaceae bacterium]